MDKLSERFMYYCGLLTGYMYLSNSNVDVGDFVDDIKHVQDLIDAEEQGLLSRLPCKYNDVLYWTANGYAQKVWFKGIRCDKGYKPQIIATYIDGTTLNPKETPITLLENIGKTVFLTKEEAEQKLAELN